MEALSEYELAIRAIDAMKVADLKVFRFNS